MKVLIDTNIILDLIGKREPYFSSAAELILLSAAENIEAYITSNTVTDIYYIACRHYVEEREARDILYKLIKIIGVLEVSQKDCVRAFDIQMDDYEDALLATCAKRISADYIITRDTEHFMNSPVAAISPTDFLERL